MKAKLHLMLLLLLCSIGAAASPDSLRRLEFFIDTDPGIGNGTQYTITTQRDTFSGTGISMAIPAGIRPGWHTIYVRSFADSFGYDGRWSTTAAQQFFVPIKIVAAEYFFDTDPGQGMATTISIASPADTVSLTQSISTTGLTAGLHTLYTRTKDNRGIWSSAIARSFYVKDVVIAGEYFFDIDPGPGNGSSFTFSSPTDTASKSFSITTPANIPDGKHVLYVRTKTAGKWSLVQARDFFVLPRINAAEYFFDNDPGFGNGTPITIATPSDTVSIPYTISTTSLNGGMHRLYVRTRSVSGRWSIAQERSFYVRPKIIAAEYFWDIDPGTGSGFALNVTTQSDTVESLYTIKAPCLMPGTHYLYIRTKDEFGHWSVTAEDTASFSNPSIVATATYPGPGPYGTPVKVLGSGGVAPYTYKMGSGTASSDSLFLPANNTTVSFTAIDTCGYSGSTTINTPAAPTLIAGGNTGSGSVSLTGYRFWTYVQDANGNIIGAVRDNRQSLGTLSMSYAKNNSGSVRTYPGNGMYYLDRNWYVSSGSAPVSNVGLQLFAVDSEYNALVAADPLVTSKSTLRINKYDGPNEDLSVFNNSSSTYAFMTPDSIVTFNGPTSTGNGYALAFSVGDFSEFYESRGSIMALPIQSVDLKAAKAGAAVQLNWHTMGEKTTRRHVLSRGSSAADMWVIDTQLPGVAADNSYSFIDNAPLQGINYYRISVESYYGTHLYSQTIAVRFDAGRTLTIAPNPVGNMLFLGGLQSGDALQLRDVAGHIVWQGSASGPDLSLGTADFANGIYMLTVEGNGNRMVQRIEIAH